MTTVSSPDGGGATDAAPQPSDVGLGDIIVTANKRAERIQDVPISVTVLTADVIERENVRELEDLTKLVPGLTINYGSQPGNFAINMRGIGTFSNGIAVESDVAVVIDDVPAGFQAAAFKDLIDVERIEALRGPQSTLFGKSAIAGVLNITTQKPTDDFSGKATALVTDDNEWRVGGTISGPLSDTLGFRLTVSKTDYDGPIRNLTTGGHKNGSEGFTLTGKLRWNPADNFEVMLSPRYNETDNDCCASAIRSLVSSTGAPLYYRGIKELPQSLVLKGITISPTNVSVRHDVRGGGKARVYGGTAHLSYTFDPDSLLGAATLQAITSFDRWRMRDFQDVDGTDVPYLFYFPLSNPSRVNQGVELHGLFHAKSETAELRLTSPGNGPFQYVAGLWYAHNAIDRFLDRGPVETPARYLAVSSNSNYAMFAQASWKILDKVTLIGGLRVNRQDIDFDYTKDIPTQAHFAQADTDRAVTGKAGAEYHFTPDIMAYATYSTGYKGQAYDLVSTTDSSTVARFPVPPETAKNYELGFKSSLFDRRVYFNAAIYRADFYGFQTSITSVEPDTGRFVTVLHSVGQLRSQGVEADLLARITPNFQLNGAAAYLDAKVIDFPNGPCYSGQTAAEGCYNVTPDGRLKAQDLGGKRLGNAPEFKFNIGGQYDFDLESLWAKPFIALTYRWQSKTNGLSQDPLTVRGAYGIFDAKVGLISQDDRYKLTFFVNNVFDKNYPQSLSRSGSGFSGIPSSGTVVSGMVWTPARDTFRYFGMRADVKF